MSFTSLAPTDFVVSSDSITAPAWSSNTPTLTSFYTASGASSTGITSDAFYLPVYQINPTGSGATTQFSIPYGNLVGSGSTTYNSLIPGYTPSLTTYKQYRTLVYGAGATGNQGFNFGGLNSNAQEIWVINVDRNRYKESLFPGTFNLTLSGSAGKLYLADNSNDSSVISYLDCGRVFQIVSGSNGIAVSTTPTNGIANGQTASGSYGLFLPDIGTIILNPAALNLSASYGGINLATNTTTTSTPTSSLNNNTLYSSLVSFQLNSQETVSSNYVFVRIGNAEYNYTSNPTFLSGSTGNLLYPNYINSPQTYITTVGLYNTNNELLAVGKVSAPLVKDFTKEALIRVKLDW